MASQEISLDHPFINSHPSEENACSQPTVPSVNNDGIKIILPNNSLMNNSLYGWLREAMQTKARSTVDFYERKYEILSQFLEEDSDEILEIFKQAQEDIRSDREVVLQALAANMDCITFCSQDIQCDREIIMMALQHDGEHLSLIQNTDLAKDRELVYMACCSSSGSVRYADESLRNDKEFMLQILQSCNGYAYDYLGDELFNDMEIALAAVSVDGDSFRVFSEEIRNNREIFLKAIRTAPHWYVGVLKI